MSNDDIKELMENCLVKKKGPVIIKPSYGSDDDRLGRRKNEALKIARDLHYSNDILSKIKQAKTFGDVDRALAAGRKQIPEVGLNDKIKRKNG